jgi:predicted DNA-binding ArsR family transcriptional regulator
MIRIIAAFKRYVQYHTTYFNVAKQYINSLTDLTKINKFTYGTDVIDAIDNKAIKQILKNGGSL